MNRKICKLREKRGGLGVRGKSCWGEWGGGEGLGASKTSNFATSFLIAFHKYETKSGSLCGPSFHMMPLTFDQVCTA